MDWSTGNTCIVSRTVALREGWRTPSGWLSSSFFLSDSSFVFPQPLIVSVLPWDSGLVPQHMSSSFLTLAIWSAIWRRSSSSPGSGLLCHPDCPAAQKHKHGDFELGWRQKPRELMTWTINTLTLCSYGPYFTKTWVLCDRQILLDRVWWGRHIPKKGIWMNLDRSTYELLSSSVSNEGLMQHFCLGSKEESVHRADIQGKSGDITIRDLWSRHSLHPKHLHSIYPAASPPWTISQLLHPFSLSPETFSTKYSRWQQPLRCWYRIYTTMHKILLDNEENLIKA